MICSKFLPFEVVAYLYSSTIQPCMECCCHVWIGAPSCYLNILEMLQKWLWSYIVLYRTVGPTLAASVEPLVHLQNVANPGVEIRS